MDFSYGSPYYWWEGEAPASPEVEVDDLVKRASWTARYGKKIAVLKKAIEKCKHHRLNVKQAAVHCQIAYCHILYNPDLPDLALMEANSAISSDPNSAEGHYALGLALRECGSKYVGEQKPVDGDNAYSRSIQEFIKSYKMSTKKEHGRILDAIATAVDHDMTDLLNLKEMLNSDECTEVIKFMAASYREDRFKREHINYLFLTNEKSGSGVAQTLACDLRNFSWRLLLEKNSLECDTIKAIISLGGLPTLSDIQCLVEHSENISILEIMVENCSPRPSCQAVDNLFRQAVKWRKFMFSEYIAENFPSVADGDLNKLIIRVLKQKNFKFLEAIMGNLQNSGDLNYLIDYALKHQKYFLILGLASHGVEISVARIVKEMKKVYIHSETKERHISFIRKLLEIGMDPNGVEGEICPLDAVLDFSKDRQMEQIQLLIVLLQCGAAIEQCTYQRKNRTTLLHVATQLAVDSGDSEAMKLLEVVCEHYPYCESGKVQDKRGETPWHIVMKRRRSPNALHICEILSRYPINPSIPDEHGKTPGQGRNNTKQDKRYIIMQEVAKQFQTVKKKSGKRRQGKSSAAFLSITAKDTSMPSIHETPQEAMQKKNVNECNLDVDEVLHDIKEQLSLLSNQAESYFEPPLIYKKQRSLPHKSCSEMNTAKKRLHQEESEEESRRVVSKDAVPGEVQPAMKREVDIQDIPRNFEGRPWEVECTDKVKKFFANPKVPRSEKEAVVKAVDKLADGIPINKPKVCKEVRSAFKLYESRYLKGSRIIFELAIQFSPRLTIASKAGDKEYIYSEVIRLWDVVRDHDNLNSAIDRAVQCVTKSHTRGETAAVHTPLKIQNSQNTQQSTQGQVQPRLPRFYILRDSEVKIEEAQTQLFYPAGSTKEDEYNVVTFYSFDTSFVRSMLDGENARRDFPFKEWPKEHDIISMPQGKVSILLLGRSGTGKTTCCLYRLWNQFQNYWLQVVDNEPFLSRQPLSILEEKNGCETDDGGLSEENNPSAAEGPDVCNNPSATEGPDVCNNPSAAEGPDVCIDTYEQDEILPAPDQLDHFHQVFITKNYVLCAQMKKRFYDLAAGKDFSANHMEFEDADVPSSLQEMQDHAYPLFLTARQFFILLDNSLQDGKNFFQRDEEGQLIEKIISSDYDHEDPDTLLDLEESDSEDEVGDYDFDEDLGLQLAKEKKRQQQRREVTASYFAEKIWPKISNNSKLDPLLVWMEIKSFIKGSRQSVNKEKGILTKEEYEDLGRKMAPNYVDQRQEIYQYFELYMNFVKHQCQEDVFDECDLNHNIFSRLNGLADLPWSIHSIYIDEVQDFTQAELSILLRICRNPNDLFLTGDTAQSIMRGISFRFSDLKSIFYYASNQVSKHIKLEVPKVDELTINFRSHTGVLQLAASIIDLMKAFFPNSFDCLPGDEGMFPGPRPIVLDSCNVSDLALVLRTNKRESSTIEFGAHQVIIVQSEEAKKSIPDVLKAGIVLTVFESKGLEFDDVLLYNFFKDSKVGKVWRVVTSYIEDDPSQVVSSEAVFAESSPRRLNFDASQHKSLNAELKYLYTAITRAKCNLWIYDSDKDKRLPVFDYWNKKGLVKVIRITDISEDDQGTLFSATSSKEEWKSQGDYFRKKRLWEPAMKCYQKAECLHLLSEARAYSLAQQARTFGLKPKEVEEIYLKSAHEFLKCDQSQHDYQCLENAAKCLKNAKRYEESAELYLHFGQLKKAHSLLIKTRKPEKLAIVKDKLGDYDGVIRLLIKYDQITEALKYAKKYEGHYRISKVHSVRYLASRHAEKLVSQLDNELSLTMFEEVLEYLPLSDQIDYFKSAGMHEKACEILLKEGRYEELYKIYKGQGWYEEGMQLAKEQKDWQRETTFTLFKAAAELQDGKISNVTVKQLKNCKSETDSTTSLVLGMANIQNPTMILSALRKYKASRHSLGYVEAFVIAIERLEYDEQTQEWKNIRMKWDENVLNSALLACKEVRAVVETLQAKTHNFVQGQILLQLERFYGFEKRLSDEVYIVPPSSYPWTNELLKELNLEEEAGDADGMLQVKVDIIHKCICNRLETFLKKWIVNDEYKLVENFYKTLRQHPLHTKMVSGGYLTEVVSASDKSLNFYTYYHMLTSAAFDIAYYRNSTDEADEMKALLSLISPQATCYLPISHLKIDSDILIQILSNKASSIVTSSNTYGAFIFNKWLEAWRVNCVTKKGMKDVLNRLGHHREPSSGTTISGVCEHQRSQDQSFQDLPPTFVLDRTHEYKHIMLLWTSTCEFIRERNILSSCTIAVHNIIRHVASHRAIWTTISISNFLHIVTIHTTAILTMYAACSAFQQREGNMYVPFSYKRVITIFQNMNSIPADSRKLNTDFFKSCIEDVKRRRDHGKLFTQLRNLLAIIMRVMTGMHNEGFNPLRYALSTDNCLENHEAQHCLIFVLTLFGNIGLMPVFSDFQLQNYRKKIYDSVKHCKNPALQDAYNRFATSATIVGTFGALKRLLEASKDSLICANFFFDPTFNNEVKPAFNPAYLMRIFQRRLHPIPVDSITQQLNPVVMRSRLSATAKEFYPQGLAPTSATSTASPESVPDYSTQDSAEADVEDPEVIAALRQIAESGPTAETPFMDNPMVDQTLCRICGCELMSDSLQEAEDATPLVEKSSLDTYSHHCRTEQHYRKLKLYEFFDREEKDYYIPRKMALHELLFKSGTLYESTKDKELHSTVNNVEEEMRASDDKITLIRNSTEWSEGLNLIQRDLSGKLDALHRNLKKAIEESEKRKLELERAKELEVKMREEEGNEMYESDEEEEIEQANYGEKDRTMKRMKARSKRSGQRK